VLLGEVIENRDKTMDFMFEDDVDEVGSDIEAYCPKCKVDTTHVVISKYEDEIRRVQCNPCGDVHSFRKPRGEAEEDIPEPVAARKRAMLKKPTWNEFFAKHGEKGAKNYEFRETYRENNIVIHPKFGKGFISEVVSDSKVEITFSDARRILVHNRKDIPGSPVGNEDDGLPSTAPVVKPTTKGAGKGQAKAAQGKAQEEKPDMEEAPEPEDKKAEPKHDAKVAAPVAKDEKLKSPEKAEKKIEKKAVDKPEKTSPKAVGKIAAKKPEKKTEKKVEKKASKKSEKKLEKKPNKKAEKKPKAIKKHK
jgi:hypothetical protein